MGVGTISSKTVVGILSVLFLAAAIGMWAMGGYVIHTYKNNLDHFFDKNYTLIPAGVMILVGVIFLLGAIAGFCATFRDTRACSLTFFIFILVVFATLLTAIILSFTYKHKVHKFVDDGVNSTMYEYGEPGQNETTHQVDTLQHDLFKCCGTYNYTFWNHTKFGNHSAHHYVPVSCCRNMTGCFNGDLDEMQKQPGGVKEYIYEVGCVDAMEKWVKNNLYYLGAGAIAFLVLLILGMIGACVVLWQKKEGSYFNLEYKATTRN